MKVMHIQYNERNLKNCIQICCGIESFWYVVELQRCLKCRTFAVAKIFVFLIHYIVILSLIYALSLKFILLRFFSFNAKLSYLHRMSMSKLTENHVLLHQALLV
jgi:hypothetical protein